MDTDSHQCGHIRLDTSVASVGNSLALGRTCSRHIVSVHVHQHTCHVLRCFHVGRGIELSVLFSRLILLAGLRIKLNPQPQKWFCEMRFISPFNYVIHVCLSLYFLNLPKLMMCAPRMYTRNQARAQSWVRVMHFFKLGSAQKSQKKNRKKFKKKTENWAINLLKISSINPELALKNGTKKSPAGG